MSIGGAPSAEERDEGGGILQLERLIPCATLAEASRLLAGAVVSTGARQAAGGRGPRILRIEQPLTGMADPVRWLKGQARLPRFYWLNRSGDVAHAGAGISEIVGDRDFGIVDEVVRRLTAGSDSSDPRLLVTSRFDLGREPDHPWDVFGRVTLWLPLLELCRRNDGAVLAVNLKIDSQVEDVLGQQASVAVEALTRGLNADGAGSPLAEAPAPYQIDEASARAAWDHGVQSLLEAIERGRLHKCVLARRTVRTYGGRDPLERLQDAVDRFPDTYRFFVEPAEGIAFIGASPELLYRRRDREINSEALGGTRPRGSGGYEDERFASELLHSAKDALEHEVVLTFIVDRLRAFCEVIEVEDGPQLHRLPNVQHLRTGVRGHLTDGVGDAALLRALHPTPAVCGQPTECALEFLRCQEDFDRGLYSGVVGLVGRRDAEFTVAIRSALVRPGEVQFFAGAGIVTGSQPDDEWEETESKLRAMMELLDARDRAVGG